MDHELAFSDPGAAGVIRDLQTILGLIQQIKAAGGGIGIGGGPGGVGGGASGGGIASMKWTSGLIGSTYFMAGTQQIARQDRRATIARVFSDAQYDFSKYDYFRGNIGNFTGVGGDARNYPRRDNLSQIKGIKRWRESIAISRMRDRMIEKMGQATMAAVSSVVRPEQMKFKFGNRTGFILADMLSPAAWTKALGARAASPAMRLGARHVFSAAGVSLRQMKRFGTSAGLVMLADMAIQAQEASWSGTSPRSMAIDRYQRAQSNAQRFGISTHPMMGDKGRNEFAGFSATDIFYEFGTGIHQAWGKLTGEGNIILNRYNVETALANYSSAWNTQGAYDAARQAAYDDPYNNDPVKSLRERYKKYYHARPKAQAHRSTLTIFSRTEKGG